MKASLITSEQEVWHKDYNLDGKDNLQDLPAEKALFGIFAVVRSSPANCRYVAAADNLRQAVKDLFEAIPDEGMRQFMQGPWIKMIRYMLMPSSTENETPHLLQEWIQQHKPAVSPEGEYPGYYV